MPLLDHFHGSLAAQHHWESFYSNWTTRLADALYDHLPVEFMAAEYAQFPDRYEVQVSRTTGDRRLVAGIEIISPNNKSDSQERRAFATRCVSYLHQDISLILIDIVTTRQANLHKEVMGLIESPDDLQAFSEVELYATAYRPVLRQERAEVHVWAATFAVGEALPTMPLRLIGDLFVPVDFEATYQEACRRRRLA